MLPQRDQFRSTGYLKVTTASVSCPHGSELSLRPLSEQQSAHHTNMINILLFALLVSCLFYAILAPTLSVRNLLHNLGPYFLLCCYFAIDAIFDRNPGFEEVRDMLFVVALVHLAGFAVRWLDRRDGLNGRDIDLK